MDERNGILGRRITLAFCIAVVAISALNVSFYLAVHDGAGWPLRLGRFGLTVLLAVAIYRGSVAAKWIGVVLMYLSGAVGALMAIVVLLSLNPFGLGLVVMSVVYILFATLLVTLGPVRAYVEHRALLRNGWQAPPAPPVR